MPDETTGSHAIPPAPRAPSTPPAAGWRRDLITAAIAVALGVGGGVSGGIASSSADAARLDQRMLEVERRVASTEDQRDRTVRIEATLAGIDRRLGRIEDRLERGGAQ